MQEELSCGQDENRETFSYAIVHDLEGNFGPVQVSTLLAIALAG